MRDKSSTDFNKSSSGSKGRVFIFAGQCFFTEKSRYIQIRENL
ncbi:MAG: hypothetical protein ABRQ39_21805 [Candidatus Eremiobacterota bacterium]